MVLTAKGDEDNEVRVFELGADDFITKPFRAKRPVGTARGGPRPPPRLTRPPLTATSSTPVRPITRDSTGPGEALPDRSGRPRADQARRSVAGGIHAPSAAHPPKAQPERVPLRLPARAEAGGARARLPPRRGSVIPSSCPRGCSSVWRRTTAGSPTVSLAGNGSNELIQATLAVVAGLRRRGRGAFADFLALPLAHRRPRRPLRPGAA